MNQGNSVWAEAMAWLFAASNAVKMGFPRVMFEGDTKLVFSHWWIQIATPLGKCPQSWMIFPHFVIPLLIGSFLL
jgi:hypothetical protein